MTDTHSRVSGRAYARAVLIAIATVLSLSASAATTVYEYDALGRLRVVTHDNRIVTTYALDPAGNRTEVTDVAIGPTSAPSSISVPASNNTGDYSISWGAATGTVLSYELWESTNVNFSPSSRVHNDPSRTATFTNKSNNTTFYYRVRACANTDCSSYTAGANGVAIFIPAPGAPASIAVPSSSSTGNYSITWGTASGPVQTYELYESDNASFSPQSPVAPDTTTSKAFSGKPNGSTYYYRVRACGRGGCSAYATGANGVTTIIPPPSAPSPINVPSSSSTGNYSITWSTASGSVHTYELYESLNSSFSPQSIVVPDTNTSKAFSGKPHGSTHYYRVRACGTGGCGGYATGLNGVTTTIPPPSAPSSIFVPTSNTSSVYTIAWGTSTGAVSTYELYESASPSFATQTLKPNNTPTTANITPVNGTFYYRVRACGIGGCSGYTAGANGIVVNVPPGAPTNLRMTHAGNCWWRAEWNAVSGAANYVVLDTVGNQQTVVAPTANVTCPLNNQNAIKPKEVKACTSAGSCSTSVSF